MVAEHGPRPPRPRLRPVEEGRRADTGSGKKGHRPESRRGARASPPRLSSSDRFGERRGVRARRPHSPSNCCGQPRRVVQGAWLRPEQRGPPRGRSLEPRLRGRASALGSARRTASAAASPNSKARARVSRWALARQGGVRRSVRQGHPAGRGRPGSSERPWARPAGRGRRARRPRRAGPRRSLPPP